MNASSRESAHGHPHGYRNHHGPGPYRSRNGLIFGVCRGLAGYFGFNVIAVRLVFLFGALFLYFWPAGFAYVLAALLMKPEPVVPFSGADEAEFYQSFANSRSMALQRLKRQFDNLDRRIQRMEDIVTNREYHWDQRLNGRGEG